MTMETVDLGRVCIATEFYVPWRPCPGCGTTLAGTWAPVVALVPAGGEVS